MLKYFNYQLTFAEVPRETTICINITGCPNKCPACHSKFLWADTGHELNEFVLDDMLTTKDAELGTCVCFMGGDQEEKRVFELADHVRRNYKFKTAWYSGKTTLNDDAKNHFDYIKVGPYIEEFGSLNMDTTNQRMYEVKDGELIDVTNRFWL